MLVPGDTFSKFKKNNYAKTTCMQYKPVFLWDCYMQIQNDLNMRTKMICQELTQNVEINAQVLEEADVQLSMH